MTQFDFGNLSSPLPGAELADGVLEPWRDALHSSHMGDSRPSYVVPGMWWIDNATTPWVAKVFQGSDDIVMGTLDPTTLVFTASGGGSPIAEDVSYDNTSSGLSADNVQDAIDETIVDFDTKLEDYQPINPRIYSIAATGLLTPTSNIDLAIVTSQNGPIIIGDPTGTWVQGQGLIIRLKDNGTARAITWQGKYRALGVTLPTTTVPNKLMYVSMMWNATDNKFDVTGVAQEA